MQVVTGNKLPSGCNLWGEPQRRYWQFAHPPPSPPKSISHAHTHTHTHGCGSLLSEWPLAPHQGHKVQSNHPETDSGGVRGKSALTDGQSQAERLSAS